MKQWGKLLSAVLIVFLCMLCVVPCAVWAEDAEVQNVEQTETGAEEGVTEDAEEEDNTVEKVKTGLDPLWTILDLKAPETVTVGQEFEVIVTVRNMGTGPGFRPEFQLTEDKDRKELTNFTLLGGENGVYDTLYTQIDGGETHMFTLKLKVNEDTRELPEGSKYRINCAIASDNYLQTEEKRFKAVENFELEVLYALSEPSFVVENVTFDPAVDRKSVV